MIPTHKVIIIILITFIGLKESYGQEFSLIGTWLVKEIDCYEKGSAPYLETRVSKLNNPTGSITFKTNGKGEILSTNLILCNINDFYWYQNGDTLIMVEDSLTIPFYLKIIREIPKSTEYYSLIHWNDQNNIKIERAPGCKRFGYTSWYDVVLERTNK